MSSTRAKGRTQQKRARTCFWWILYKNWIRDIFVALIFSYLFFIPFCFTVNPSTETGGFTCRKRVMGRAGV